MKYKLILSIHSLEDLYQLYRYNHKLVYKSLELLMDAHKHPFEGIGKPEHLRYFSANVWSRRINDEHRLVYEVASDEIIVFSFLGHYEK
jgi:toxin YoeB